MKKYKLALLNMYKGHPNEGMRALVDIINNYSPYVEMEHFDVRGKNELPDEHFDIYISSGGPGNPTDMDNPWISSYFSLIDRLWAHNLSENRPKKYAFFICHSFQLVAYHFKLGEVTKRNATSFGIYPIHKTAAGKEDHLLTQLPNPYYAVDSRDYQLIQPNLKVFENYGAKILSLEKIRTHVEYERAIMAVRLSNEFVGTQYHPEADAEGMKIHFLKSENRDKVINNLGEEKFRSMIEKLEDPDKIELTHRSIIPSFIEHSIESLTRNKNKVPAA